MTKPRRSGAFLWKIERQPDPPGEALPGVSPMAYLGSNLHGDYSTLSTVSCALSVTVIAGAWCWAMARGGTRDGLNWRKPLISTAILQTPWTQNPPVAIP